MLLPGLVRGIIRRLAAESKLLTHPLILVSVAAFVIVVGTTTALSIARVVDQASGLDARLTRFNAVCHGVADASCPPDLVSARDSERALADEYRLILAAADPAGAVFIPAGMIASAPGLILLAVTAAVHAAGEFSRGTVAVRFSRDPRKVAFVGSKYASLLAVATIASTLSWGLVLALGLASRAAWDLPTIPSEFRVGMHPQLAFAHSAVVVMSAASYFLLVGVIVRHELGAGVASVGSVGLLLTASWFDEICRWSWACWVANYMEFDRGDLGTGFIWVSSAISEREPLVWGLGLGLVTLIGLAASWWLLRTSSRI